MYTLQFIVYSFTVYSVKITVYSVQWTVYIVQCIVNSEQFTVYSAKCTMSSIQNIVIYTQHKNAVNILAEALECRQEKGSK